MGYYIRVLAPSEAVPFLTRLLSIVPEGQELLSESHEEPEWTQLRLRHKTGQEIALIERNPVRPGELGQEELNEFIDNIQDEKPDSAVQWLLRFLPRVRTIYAFQLLSGRRWMGRSSRGAESHLERGRRNPPGRSGRAEQRRRLSHSLAVYRRS